MATNSSVDLQLCRYCYGTIVSLPGFCSNCRHFWSRDDRGGLRCQFGGRSIPVSGSAMPQPGSALAQQQGLHQAQVQNNTASNVHSTMPSAPGAPNPLFNQPRSSPSTVPTYQYALFPQLSALNIPLPSPTTNPLPSQWDRAFPAVNTTSVPSPTIVINGEPNHTPKVPKFPRYEGPAPKLFLMPDQKRTIPTEFVADPRIGARKPKVETVTKKAPLERSNASSSDENGTITPGSDSTASMSALRGNSAYSPPQITSHVSGPGKAPLRRYQRAKLLDVYTDISRQLFMTSSLSEGFWKQTQALGVLHPNCYFFRHLKEKLQDPALY